MELQRYFTLLSIMTNVNHQLDMELERILDNYSDDGVKTIDENENSPLFEAVLGFTLKIIQGRKDHLLHMDD
jgi:hypothetical protein